MATKMLNQLTEEEFYVLKKTGMLWEMYPESPEFFNEIIHDNVQNDGDYNELFKIVFRKDILED